MGALGERRRRTPWFCGVPATKKCSPFQTTREPSSSPPPKKGSVGS